MSDKENHPSIYLGQQPYQPSLAPITGEEITLEGETYYKISAVDRMRPFFMSIVSHSDHWMFLASNGGLSAGRVNSDFALFPYYTDDKITESADNTGCMTILLVEAGDRRMLWQPFSNQHRGVYSIERNLYKNAYGNKVVFEEINHDLNLTFRYQWAASELYGFVRQARLTSFADQPIQVSVLDGIQNVLPYGVPEGLQRGSSNLVDAYKKCELEDGNLGIFALSAIISDKAEPSESLKANVVWSVGFESPKVLLSSQQLEAFKCGQSLETETDIKAERGAYFVQSSFELAAHHNKEWVVVANLGQSIRGVIRLKRDLQSPDALKQSVLNDVAQGSNGLIALVAASDGLQLTADRRRNIRHFANTMFNIMRGGIFDENYAMERADFMAYIDRANHKVFFKKAEKMSAWPEKFDLFFLQEQAKHDDDLNFKRLCAEYLPLKFSRRHGDPSRPWNKFSINLRNEDDGSKILDYQGNWRDIFQNWEALVHAYPQFIEGMIFKFLNATTFDGYNPYRVFKDGFEWETIEPDNPWSYIGYWGDHQIIYLLKFLEFLQAYDPDKLEEYIQNNSFVYANVPYRIKSYDALLEDPKNTIDFDHEREEKIGFKKDEIGGDGALLREKHVFIYKVNFIEKIMATMLAKIANFIPEGGIWMNTQRPEWNDANNALVGNGVSMVTLCYLRRFLVFFQGVLAQTSHREVSISDELLACFKRMDATLREHLASASGPVSNATRRMILDGLGSASSDFRQTIYNEDFSGLQSTLSLADLTSFVEVALEHLEHTIRANKRADGLYHAYNLMTVEPDGGIAITELPEMLEGQVAVLSSGLLNAADSLAVMDALKASALFRDDQYSYVLYPNKSLPRFLQKNNIDPEAVSGSKLLAQLVADQHVDIVTQDCLGGYHFNGNLHNVHALRAALRALPQRYQSLVKAEQKQVEDVYEGIFNHKAFTGRSGTFFGYEGLGSIYWHMVSKLRLAMFEVTKAAVEQGEAPEIVGRLFDHYFEINAGIGAHKSPDLYGAFPTDPYSHTPGGKGAQQPGMTGQVKEDLLCRFGELGVRVSAGQLHFDRALMHSEEFLTAPATFDYVDVQQQRQTLELTAGSLAYTVCQVPVVHQRGDQSQIVVHMTNGETRHVEGLVLDREVSAKIFRRTHEVTQLTVIA
ncbi:MAG: hypothetical protein O3B70_08975 [Bacteroidetes bacterium]|nr:hypothetical protein [Bacteroidota bacterium]MDA0904455.1 hypothetical protein [Bacteroidota bacterium]